MPVATARSRPRRNAPPSPIKMVAGLKLCGRNPIAIPAAMIATSGPKLGWLKSPRSDNLNAYRKNAPAPIATIPQLQLN